MRNRCKDSKYIINFFLEGYQLSFCSIDRGYGAANIVKNPDSKVPGGVWKISESDEKELDYYEGFPIKYEKDFFTLNGDKVMFYIIKRQYSFKQPQRRYVNIINQGYKDCQIDREYLRRRLMNYNIDLR